MPCREAGCGWKNVLLGQHYPSMCRVAQRTRLGVENWRWTRPNPKKPCNAHLCLCHSRGLALMRLLNSISKWQLRKLLQLCQKRTEMETRLEWRFSHTLSHCLSSPLSSIPFQTTINLGVREYLCLRTISSSFSNTVQCVWSSCPPQTLFCEINVFHGQPHGR